MSVTENTIDTLDLTMNVDKQTPEFGNHTEMMDSVSSIDEQAHCKNGDDIEIKIELCDPGLWELFNNVVNEMIVTRDGRRMFPVLKVSVCGLQPNSMYKIALDFLPADTYRWKYVNGEWIRGTRVDLPPSTRSYFHPDSPNYGAFWMQNGVSFARAKITNREDHSQDKIYLYSMHKYTPRVTIYKVSNNQEEDQNISSASFRITEFIAVTAYQNESVTLLKVKFNPFAKAFLDSSAESNEGKYNENLRKGEIGKNSSLLNQNNLYNGGMTSNLNKYNNNITWNHWNNFPYCNSNINYQPQNNFAQYGFSFDYMNSRGYNNSSNSMYDVPYNHYQPTCSSMNYSFNGYRYSAIANRSVYSDNFVGISNTPNGRPFSYPGYVSSSNNKSEEYLKVNQSDYCEYNSGNDSEMSEKSKSKLNFLAEIAAKFKHEEGGKDDISCSINQKRMAVDGSFKEL